MRILITGASGLLGLNLAMEATRRHTVFGTVNHHPLKTDAFTVIQADLLAPGAVERLLDSTQPDWVIHCAALANLDACEADPLQAQKMNTELPRTLASHVARSGARLVHISTDAVFDGMRGDYSEQDTPTPACVYSRTKLEGEQAVAEVNPNAIVARVVFFGWSLVGTRSLAEFFFNNLSQGRRVSGFTNMFFCPLLANQLGKVLLHMLELNLSGLFHVVGPEPLSKYEFGIRLARRFNLNTSLIDPVIFTQPSSGAVRSPNLSLRSDKLTRAIGQILPNVSTGLDELFTLYQQGYPQELQRMGATQPETRLYKSAE